MPFDATARTPCAVPFAFDDYLQLEHIAEASVWMSAGVLLSSRCITSARTIETSVRGRAVLSPSIMRGQADVDPAKDLRQDRRGLSVPRLSMTAVEFHVTGGVVSGNGPHGKPLRAIRGWYLQLGPVE
jgi:hypothetical protein